MSPLLAWILLILYALLITMTATVVILENRTPAKTVAWIIVLVGMPVVGLVLFYFIPSRSHRSVKTKCMGAGATNKQEKRSESSTRFFKAWKSELWG